MVAAAIANPSHLAYTSTHEWVQRNDDNTLTIGITHHAQDQLGDIVFVELPEIGADISAGEEIIVVESVKTAADIYAPATGTITAINPLLQSAPETINESPFESGWLCKIKLTDPSNIPEFLNAAQYTQQTDED